MTELGKLRQISNNLLAEVRGVISTLEYNVDSNSEQNIANNILVARDKLETAIENATSAYKELL